MIHLFQRKGNFNRSSYCNCRLILKKADLQKINFYKTTLRKVTDLLSERHLFKDQDYQKPDLLAYSLNFKKSSVFHLNTGQRDLKRYPQWL